MTRAFLGSLHHIQPEAKKIEAIVKRAISWIDLSVKRDSWSGCFRRKRRRVVQVRRRCMSGDVIIIIMDKEQEIPQKTEREIQEEALNK